MTSLVILVDGDNQPIQVCNYTGTSGTPPIIMLCDHCDAEYDDIGAPLACGHNICGCRCVGECPDAIEEQFAHVMFDRVLEQLLWVVPRYEE